jgi:hypothetical protein
MNNSWIVSQRVNALIVNALIVNALVVNALIQMVKNKEYKWEILSKSR